MRSTRWETESPVEGGRSCNLCPRTSTAGCCWELLPQLPALLEMAWVDQTLSCTILSPWH